MIAGHSERVQSFVRIRPLVGAEITKKHAKLAIKIAAEAATKKIQIMGHSARKEWKFRDVISEDMNNVECYKVGVDNLVDFACDGGSACCFSYGHTGSGNIVLQGKSHTILGYGEEKGMYRLAAEKIENTIKYLNPQLSSGMQLLVEVRFAEIYNGKAYDLLDNRAAMFVREDANGQVHIRGQVSKDSNGKFRVKTLKRIRGSTAGEVVRIVEKGLQARVTGSSGVHDQSSRSHAVLELEIVTNDIIAARDLESNCYCEMMHLGGLYQGLKMKTTSLSETKFSSPYQLRKAFELAEKEHAEAQYNLNVVEKNSPAIALGSLTFIDLAGSEYASAMVGATAKSKKEQDEAREINMSLLALKQCIRDIKLKKQRIPFRNSKLTMVLKSHLLAKDTMTTLIANVRLAK